MNILWLLFRAFPLLKNPEGTVWESLLNQLKETKYQFDNLK